MPAMSCRTSVVMPKRSMAGFNSRLIWSEVRVTGASMCARPAMATFLKSIAIP